MKRLMLVVCSVMAISIFGLSANLAYADSKSAITGGIEGATGETIDSTPEGEVNSLIQEIVNIFSIIIGAIAVVMIMYGGFRYVTSGGDNNAVASAKKILIYAVIGLVVVALAQVLVRFAIGLGGDATNGNSSQQSGGNSQSGGNCVIIGGKSVYPGTNNPCP